MKYLSILFISVLFIVGIGCTDNEFDEKHIVVSFGVMSDVHIDGVDTDAGIKFKSALEQLRDSAAVTDPHSIAGILIAGDLINNAYKSPEYYCQVEYFKTIYESVFDPVSVPMVYTPGNHDTYREWTSNTISEAQNLSDAFGENYFMTDLDRRAGQTLECRHCLVAGYDVLCIVPDGRNPVVYPEASVRWLDSTLNVITRKHPGRFVLVLTHPMIYDTVYGSTLGDYWDTQMLTPVLSKYPQAVTFSGHLHFPLNDPRSIWQGAFTSFGCGCTSYMAIEDGGYEYMAGRTIMKDCRQFSQGLLVQFDRKGNMRVTRMDFYNRSTIGEPWTVLRPAKDLSHLSEYSHDRRSAANAAPVLSRLNVEVTDRNPDVSSSRDCSHESQSGSNSCDTVTAVFAAGEDDEFVHHYVLTLTDGRGDTVKVKKLLSDFYRVPRTELMKKEWREPFAVPSAGRYTLTLEAFDSWDAAANILSHTFEVESR